MGNTPNLSLPYPELSDTADVPRDIKALADAADTAIEAVLPYQILYARITTTGAIEYQHGGITVTRTSTGNYNVYYPNVFGGVTPAAVASPYSSLQLIVAFGIFSGYMTATWSSSPGGAGVDVNFSVILIGPRP